MKIKEFFRGLNILEVKSKEQWDSIKQKGKVRYIILHGLPLSFLFCTFGFVGSAIGKLMKGESFLDIYSLYAYVFVGLIAAPFFSFIDWYRNEEKYNTLSNENIENTVLNEYIDDNLINEAIQVCLSIGLVYNLNYSDIITKKYGQKMLSEISEILAFVNTIQPDLPKETFEKFLERVVSETHCKYLSLDEESLKVLKKRVAYDWKPGSQ